MLLRDPRVPVPQLPTKRLYYARDVHKLDRDDLIGQPGRVSVPPAHFRTRGRRVADASPRGRRKRSPAMPAMPARRARGLRPSGARPSPPLATGGEVVKVSDMCDSCPAICRREGRLRNTPNPHRHSDYSTVLINNRYQTDRLWRIPPCSFQIRLFLAHVYLTKPTPHISEQSRCVRACVYPLPSPPDLTQWILPQPGLGSHFVSKRAGPDVPGEGFAGILIPRTSRSPSPFAPTGQRGRVHERLDVYAARLHISV